MNEITNIEDSKTRFWEAVQPGDSTGAALRIIIAGGGTGGHIFPAIAIANALMKLRPDTEVLFVGATGKMEMEKVPLAGYRIEGLDIAGFNRSSLIKNIALPYKLLKSFFAVKKIFKLFKPTAVVGVGGYSSFPVLRFAQTKGIKTFIHESNSFAGKSNMLLGGKATKIFVATDGMEKFFPADKLVVSGNPVRESISRSTVSREDAIRFFGLQPYKKTVLAIGGSLGAKSINEALAAAISDFGNNDLQLIWQTGKPYAGKAKEVAAGRPNIWIGDFITQMEYAYAAADVVISRSGAMAIAELCIMKKAAVFVPFPFAAENHQMANAQKLVNKNAGIMIADEEALIKLVPAVVLLSKDEQREEALKKNIGKLAIANADEIIAFGVLRELLQLPNKASGIKLMYNVFAEMKEYNKILASLGAASVVREGGLASIYFLGIGGIGMSALARYFKSLGVTVSGYDKTPTALTRQLSMEGIDIHYEDDIELIDKGAQVIVFTPAVPNGHSELNFYRRHNYLVVKRSDVLGAITNSSFNICIAGTHGKTTTSTMVAHILRHSGYGCNAFLGGIAVNYESNFWSSKKNVCVVEADEYDRSFLKLSPDIAIISSMDPDHLDIYGTVENMEQAFIDFAAKVKPGGFLLHKYGIKRNAELVADEFLTYHLYDHNADIYATNITINNGSYMFDTVINDTGNSVWILKDIVLNMGGEHNIENMVAAIAVAHHIGIADDKIKMAVADFRGVKRRFEYILKNDKQVFIDDYAHHPEELRALIMGTKSMFPDKKCIVVFQPHLFSRTRDLADGFAEVLDLADETILLPVYPARELPMEGIASEMILERMSSENKIVMSKDALLKHLIIEKDAHLEEGFEGTVLVTAGAGDIDTLVEPIKKILNRE